MSGPSRGGTWLQAGLGPEREAEQGLVRELTYCAALSQTDLRAAPSLSHVARQLPSAGDGHCRRAMRSQSVIGEDSAAAAVSCHAAGLQLRDCPRRPSCSMARRASRAQQCGER